MSFNGKEFIKSLVKEYKESRQELRLITDKINTLTRQKNIEVEKLALICRARDMFLENGMVSGFPELPVIPEVELLNNPQPTIGDFIEKILKESGTMTSTEIRCKLLEANVPISKTNARIVVFNAIRRDKRNRFTVLKDGKIALRNENK
jgi:hypothetical protein